MPTDDDDIRGAESDMREYSRQEQQYRSEARREKNPGARSKLRALAGYAQSDLQDAAESGMRSRRARAARKRVAKRR